MSFARRVQVIIGRSFKLSYLLPCRILPRQDSKIDGIFRPRKMQEPTYAADFLRQAHVSLIFGTYSWAQMEPLAIRRLALDRFRESVYHSITVEYRTSLSENQKRFYIA